MFVNTPLSVVIISRNQAQKIKATIASVKSLSDDIVVVVDASTTDGTQSVAGRMGARTFVESWKGYSAQKNFGNAQAKHDWVLSIDDDEVVSETLAESIKQSFSQNIDFDALDLPFRTVFCGKQIRFGGWNPESHIRIFNKKHIDWNADMVHEGLTITPNHRVLKLNGYVYHHTVDTLEAFYEKTDRYSQLFADKAIKKGKKAGIIKTYLSPVFRFIREYFFKFGFLDGYYGWVIAKENARYTYLKYKRITY
jgi:glycosyltransferase involved in cell wall biosynthesis